LTRFCSTRNFAENFYSKIINRKSKIDMDAIDEKRKNEMLYFAHRSLYFNERIIEICDNWLPAEEANANMFREIEERRRKEREAQMKPEKTGKKENRFWKWGGN